MESTRRAPKNRPQQPPKKKRNPVLSALKIFLIILLVIGIIGAAGVYVFVNGIISKLDPIDPAMVGEQLYENSVIVDSKGRVLEVLQSKGLRTVVKFEDISKPVIDAFVAVEDKTFWEHKGFNFVRMIGAVVESITKDKRIGGTSTISQQLARNVYLFDKRGERTLERKIEEAYYTVQLEKYLTKEQILEGYLNLVYFGQNSYGIEAAANTFFSKSANELDYIEAAILTGIVKAPTLYSPLITYKKADVPEGAYIIDDTDPLYTTVYNEKIVDRYKTCIALMYENGKITEQQYKQGLEYDIRSKIHYGKRNQSEITSYFSDVVKDDVVADLMKKYNYSYEKATDVLYSGGLTIESTIDYDVQKILESHYEYENFTEYFSDSLVSAIKSFQEHNGLEVTGTANAATLAALREAAGLAQDAFSKERYAKGESHEDIALIKKSLYSKGYYVTNENFPKIRFHVDAEGNIVHSQSKKLMLHYRDNLINEDGEYLIKEGQYRYDPAGNLVLFRGNHLNFYAHYKAGDLERIQITVKDTFVYPPNSRSDILRSGRYTVDSILMYGGRDVLIPDEYKKYDDVGNVVVSRQFLAENPNFFRRDENRNLLIAKENYVMSGTPVIQPQSSFVIIDFRTGRLLALIGGRNTEGRMLYNRALHPRQPGSAIKPLSVFTPAIDSGEFTTSTVIDDRPVYMTGNPNVRWPYNWFEQVSSLNKYYGLVTLREALSVSINVPAALIGKHFGIPTLVQYLESYGITTLVKEGPYNDMNLAALTLGGMTRGIKPIEMANAYATIANKGMYNPITTYTRVTNARGEILLENRVEPRFVIDENVAYILTDMMRTSVESGVATRAKMNPANDVYQVAGKTGSTDNNMDAWFSGFTPYYAGTIWFGNDINIPLADGSQFSAGFWREVMRDLHEGLEPAKFQRPEGVVTAQVDIISGKLPTELSYRDPRGSTVRTEIFLKGTIPTEEDDVHVLAKICKASGKLATEFCPPELVEERVLIKRPEPYNPAEHENIILRDTQWDLPTETCDLHNEYNSISYHYGDISQYFGVNPTRQLGNGSLVVQRPYPIKMMSGEIRILPPSTVIHPDGSVVTPDGATILNEEIFTIQMYTAAELDEYFRSLQQPPAPDPQPLP